MLPPFGLWLINLIMSKEFYITSLDNNMNRCTFQGVFSIFFIFYQVVTCVPGFIVLLCFYHSILLLGETAVIFLDKLPWHHNLVSAAHAFQTEVCSDTHDFPLATAARMRFFQFYDISYCVFIHSIFLFYLCLPFNMLCIILCLHLYLLKYRAQSLLYQKVCSCVHRCGGLVDKHELVSVVIVYEACRRIYRK